MGARDMQGENRDLLSRREILAAGTAALAGSGLPLPAAASSVANESPPQVLSKPPFDSIRDYMAALEANGLVMRFPRVDQDQYEATALMYRLRDELGVYGAPALIFEEIKIDGRWVKGPLIANESGPMHAECVVWGLEPVPFEPRESFRKAREHMLKRVAAFEGAYPAISPVEVAPDAAPCKQVILRGDEVDLTKFPFIQVNPNDAGRYINTGAIFTEDPVMGKNFGTYRCHLRGPRKMGVNPEPNQTGWKHLMAARERGEKTAKVSMALGVDPMVWLLSATRVGGRRDAPLDEMALAGGLRGRPVQVVRSETNDHMVPAFAEMIIEGEIPLDDFEPEGPYGEMYGYMGLAKSENFWMQVTAVTHRKNPWLANSFTGVNRGALRAAGDAQSLYRIRRSIPGVVDVFATNEAPGLTFVSVNKTEKGQGLSCGMKIAEMRGISKIVVVVDADDMDVLDSRHILTALGSRWQPAMASHIYEDVRGMRLDPSSPERGTTSKIVIDATRQWPEEGGPDFYAELNRTHLVRGAPDAFARVEDQWGERIRGYRRV